MGIFLQNHHGPIITTPLEVASTSWHLSLACLFPSSRRHHSSFDENESRRRVTFSDAADMKVVENLRVEYKDDLWFSKHDMHIFKRNVVRLSIAFESKGITLAQCAAAIRDTSVFMGLENRFSNTTKEEIMCRRKATNSAVLTEQRRQRIAGVDDPEKLAGIARDQSALCQRRARIIAVLHSGGKI
mmetsp:Transcript_33185/g.69825  ORF Transcript_33185/g.69825 Transcript_33185/m.69825 type:complete len:186 (+) Transcript_33185:94-651(+)